MRRRGKGGWVGGSKQYLGALVIILLALNARGNLLRFTSVVENNSFPLYLARFGPLAARWDVGCYCCF